MAKIKLYISVSIDGYIAKSDGSLDWLSHYTSSSKGDDSYSDFYNSIGAVLMGRRTFHSIMSMDIKWPYENKDCYVVTRNNVIEQGVQIISKNVIQEISTLKKTLRKDIWLVGGGEIATMLLNQKLIDEMIIVTIPIVMGYGIPLFTESLSSSHWEIHSINKNENNTTETRYQILK